MTKIYWEIKNFLLALFAKRTMGARALVIREDYILLVKHTYISGWYTVGGGIEVGETGLQALTRELQEEVGIELKKEPTILGFYHTTQEGRDDYVIVYVVKDFVQSPVISKEILEAKWFPLTALPPDISSGTQRRIEEYLNQRPLSDRW